MVLSECGFVMALRLIVRETVMYEIKMQRVQSVNAIGRVVQYKFPNFQRRVALTTGKTELAEVGIQWR